MAVSSKILKPKALLVAIESERSQGKVIVQCHGCFDIVHPGHISYLQFAKKQGDVLVVTISSDRSIKKGIGRPYINEALRAENVSVLEFVDYVSIDDHTWAGPVLEMIRPDIYVKGKEYEINSDTRFAKERDLVESFGGHVIYGSGDVVYSSTHIINSFSQQFDLEYQKIWYFCERYKLRIEYVQQVIRKFSEQTLLVVGDLILDQYVHCQDTGVASESPILSVSPLREDVYVGGAGLIALQMAQLGAQVTFVTSVDTGRGSTLSNALDKLETGGVTVELLDCSRRSIYKKRRYVAQNQKLLKVDYGSPSPLSPQEASELTGVIRKHGSSCNAVVATDFGYGLFGRQVLESLSNMAIEGSVELYFDVSSRASSHLRYVKGVQCVLPTEAELRSAYGDYESGLSNLASRYFQETGAKQIAITLGERGAVHFKNEENQNIALPAEYLPSLASVVIDTVGAGDSFLSGFVLANVASNGDFAVGFYLGSCLSAMHLSKMANSPESLPDLEAFMAGRGELLAD
ncbi:MAG: adenylyltransferase/cytidyltransferase family protein [Gammaproteobacteria bacterium]|nr:adenylyltransferase/cytidyltransferase family protein [Gammaproteobacteria bacterium]